MNEEFAMDTYEATENQVEEKKGGVGPVLAGLGIVTLVGGIIGALAWNHKKKKDAAKAETEAPKEDSKYAEVPEPGERAND